MFECWKFLALLKRKLKSVANLKKIVMSLKQGVYMPSYTQMALRVLRIGRTFGCRAIRFQGSRTIEILSMLSERSVHVNIGTVVPV